MRIKAEQLPAQLARNLTALYVVHGDEPLLVQETCDLVRQRARESGCSQRDLFVVEGRFDWSGLLDASRNLSLFAERKLVELRIPSGKPGTEGAKALQLYCATLPPDTVTLVVLPRPDRAVSQSKWFMALEDAGVSVAVFTPATERLPHWIGERLARSGQRTDAQSLRFISDKVEGNLLAAQQEIDKLALLYPPGVLTATQVRDAVLDVARFDVFDLTDALLAGDARRLIRILHGLHDEGEAATLVLWAITRELRSLARLVDSSPEQRGRRMRELGIRDQRQSLFERALRRLQPGQVHAAMQRLAAIDRMIKGLDGGDPWLEMERLALENGQS